MGSNTTSDILLSCRVIVSRPLRGLFSGIPIVPAINRWAINHSVREADELSIAPSSLLPGSGPIDKPSSENRTAERTCCVLRNRDVIVGRSSKFSSANLRRQELQIEDCAKSHLKKQARNSFRLQSCRIKTSFTFTCTLTTVFLMAPSK